MTVTLTGYITVPDERLAAIRAALPKHIALTREEPGCLRFDVTEDETVPGRFNVSEAFTDPDAFAHHQTRAGQSDWAKVTDGIERSYKITGLPA